MAAGNSAQSWPMVPSASAALKKLRQRTGLSVGAVAAALGRPKSSYATYESKKYKKQFLPADLIAGLIPIFGKHGVDAAELRALSGIPEPDAEIPPTLDAEAEFVRECVLTIEETLQEYNPAVLIERKARMIAEFHVMERAARAQGRTTSGGAILRLVRRLA